MAATPAAADQDENGSPDLAGFDSGGRVVLANTPRTDAHVLRPYLSGHASNREGVGGVVEIRAGSLHQRHLSRPGVWPIGLGGARKADVLRLRWPAPASQRLLGVAEGALPLHEHACADSRRKVPSFPERPALWPQVEVSDGRGGWRVAVGWMRRTARSAGAGTPRKRRKSASSF